MEAKELRVGNILKSVHTGEYITADWLVIKHVMDGNKQQPPYDMSSVYEPVTLTEEKLLKCGFKSYGTEILYQDQLNKLEAYKHPMKDGHGFALKGCYALPHVKYLHQLQNLYFALTGEELNINL